MNIDESRTKKSINNIIGGLMFKLIALIFPFIIKAVMIKKLGVQYLGLNSLFTSILMVLSLSELGVGSALVYSMYKPMAENDEERICAIIKSLQKVLQNNWSDNFSSRINFITILKIFN